jgi:hypothetical protein
MANDFDLVPVDYEPFPVGAADVPSSAGWQRYDPSSDDELNARSERFLQRLSALLPSRTTHWSR